VWQPDLLYVRMERTVLFDQLVVNTTIEADHRIL